MSYLRFVLFFAFAHTAFSQVPHGAPGMIPNWSSAKKIQIGTSYSGKDSLVWFTNAQGILTETYFPTIDRAQIKDAQLLISDEKNFFLEEKTGLEHIVRINSPSLVTMINRDRLGRFEIKHTYFTLADRSTLVDEIIVDSKIDGLSFFLLVNPALNNTGYLDYAEVEEDHFHFYEADTSLKVRTSVGMGQMSVGYVGTSDGYQDLLDNNKMDWSFHFANHGNVAGMGKINIPNRKGVYKFYVTYDFSDKDLLLSQSLLTQAKIDYAQRWESYFAKLKVPATIDSKYTSLYYRSLYSLKVMSDKLHPGALIASLSKPWGEELRELPGVFTGGYHLVWPRDLYHVCTALVNAGDVETVHEALNFLKLIQYKTGQWVMGNRVIDKYGAFPQNVWTTGDEYWGGLQLDQTAYPIHIFYQLWKRADASHKRELVNQFGDMVRDALDFIVRYGPWTGQERWEENFGISPSTFSAAASALFLGQKIFNEDIYAKVANGWLTRPGDNIHTWTFTRNGVYGEGEYYIRIAGCNGPDAVWNPDFAVSCTIANSWKQYKQFEILDQGFLKLSLLGLVSAKDERIKKSQDLVNQHIRIHTPNGDGWYRYSFDAYGEKGRGRLWPLLSGEHARFAIERYNAGDMSSAEMNRFVTTTLDSYLGFANDGQMLPEQVWEESGEGTGAATPLAWTHAEFVKLLWSLDLKHNVENLL